MKTIIGTVAGFALGIGVASVLAQTSVPYYEVAEINVKIKPVMKAAASTSVREAIKAAGRQGDRGSIQEGRAYCR